MASSIYHGCKARTQHPISSDSTHYARLFLRYIPQGIVATLMSSKQNDIIVFVSALELPVCSNASLSFISPFELHHEKTCFLQM